MICKYLVNDHLLREIFRYPIKISYCSLLQQLESLTVDVLPSIFCVLESYLGRSLLLAC